MEVLTEKSSSSTSSRASGFVDPLAHARRYSVAPMLDWTDRHCRFFHRQLSRRVLLYTEMVTTGAILHGDLDRLLGRNPEETPVALQLGGSDPRDLALAIKLAEPYGYDEYNLNCGCPSERVQKGSFGACLMLEPETVATAVRAMRDATDKLVTVKHRIGVDDHDEYGFVRDFVGTVYDAGCRGFIVHTRAAWLKGLSPKENREIPPLKRDVALALKRDFPDCVIVANGQIADLDTAQALIDAGLDGVMVGRAAYHNPWHMTQVDARLYGDDWAPTREAVVEAMKGYMARVASDPMAVRATARHMIGFAQGLSGARHWRRLLSDPVVFREYGAGLLAYAWSQTFGRKR